MKELFVQNLTEGMILAMDVTTKGGQCVLSKGAVLDRQSIMRLSDYRIPSVFIQEERPQVTVTPEPVPEEEPKPVPKEEPKPVPKEEPKPVQKEAPKPAPKVAPKAYSQTIKQSPKFKTFQTDHTLVLAAIRTSFEGYVNQGTPLDLDDLLSKIQKLFDSCKTSLELFNMLHNMHSSDDSIYSHSLNVTLICRQIGKWMKVEEAELRLMTLCGLLHDIGKLKVPKEILDKPGKYTDEEFTQVKMHTQYSYDLLSPLPIDQHIKNAALSHHERFDGSGYPSGLSQDEIDDYAMLVAVADVYDAMTTLRAHRAPLCAFGVIDTFQKEGLQKYNPKYILPFLDHIARTYQNHRVMLNDGRSANVVMINKSNLSRPIIQMDDGLCIDLSTTPELYIHKVV